MKYLEICSLDLPPQKCCPSNWMDAIQGNALTGASVPSIILVKLWDTIFEIAMQPLYRVTLVVADLGWVDLNFDVPPYAQFCWGQWEFGRTVWAAGQDDGTSESKSTQPNPGP